MGIIKSPKVAGEIGWIVEYQEPSYGDASYNCETEEEAFATATEMVGDRGNRRVTISHIQTFATYEVWRG